MNLDPPLVKEFGDLVCGKDSYILLVLGNTKE